MDGLVDETRQTVPAPVRLFAVRLNAADSALRLYPEGGEIPKRNVSDLVDALRAAVTPGDRALDIGVTRDALTFGELPLVPGSTSASVFAREFYIRGLLGVRFRLEVESEDFVRFLRLLHAPTEEIAETGGFSHTLRAQGVTSIIALESETRVVDTDIPGQEGRRPEPPPEDIEEILHGLGAPRTGDYRVLLRVMRDRRAVAAYLHKVRQADPGRGATKELAERIVTLARLAHHGTLAEREAALEVIAQAVMELEIRERGELYMDRLLEEARRDNALATVLRTLGADELIDSILAKTEENPEGLEKLSHSVRDLAAVDEAETKQKLVERTAARMREKGFTERFVEDFMRMVTPKRLVGVEQAPSEAASLSAVLKLSDPTRAGSDGFVYEEAIERLRAEADRGITDGDVLATLVTVAALEPETENFGLVMDTLEEGIGFLVEAQEVEVAADVAEALLAAGASPQVPEAHRARMVKAVTALARPESLRKITAILRTYRPESPEYIASRRLLGVLGDTTIEALLEALADEDDMTARRALVDLISSSARHSIPDLGARLNDRRWYFVRNLVSIMVSTHSPEALPYLQRTLRHSDPRVRRETIRGLGSIRTGVADSMLIAALTDEDGGNVQAAAHALSSIDCRGAIPALEEVARGIGRGARDTATRVEAVNAIGRMTDPRAASALADLAKRRLFRRRVSREVRAAAALALRSGPSGRTGRGREA